MNPPEQAVDKPSADIQGQPQTCYHCGLPVPPGIDLRVEIQGEARPMCCHGCEAVAQAIIAHLDWGMDVQQALAAPHLVNRFGTYDLEEGTSAADLETALVEMGFEVNVRGLNSGLHAIEVSDALYGGADPRREGIALGE